MPDILLKDVPLEVIDQLTMRAAFERMTLETFIHKILREASESEPVVPLDSIHKLPDHRSPKD